MARGKSVELEEPEWMIRSARELSPHTSSVVLFLGPPGTGKSTAMASMCEEGKTLLIATLPREVTSWGYQKYDPDTLLLEDPGWKPAQDEYEAQAFKTFLRLMGDLSQDDEYKVVLIDNGTVLGDFAWHEALMPFKVASPGDMEDKDNRFRPYTKMADYLNEAVNAMLALKTAPLPKHVGIAWHVQATKEEQIVTVQGQKQKKASSDQLAAGAEYEGTVLPMIQGGFRRKLAGLVDVVVYTEILYEYPTNKKGQRVAGSKKIPHYSLQVRPNEDRHTKLPGLLPEQEYIPNNWAELKKLLAKGK